MITPVHPHLLLDRALTRDEMLEAVRYEGMFGIGKTDMPMARTLEAEGLIEISTVRRQTVIVNLGK